jgi:hypothetical protein
MTTELSDLAYNALCSGAITRDEFTKLNQLAGALNAIEFLFDIEGASPVSILDAYMEGNQSKHEDSNR